ncbi:MAG: succinate dehydrogenase, partial [Bacteroidales bacterium]|nr:succinate dehydrogenase [Candidatus Cryptobacteroides equifaecalis]
MFIFNSSIGKKFIQAISGAFLIIFLLLHATINFFSVIDSFTGKFGVVAADEKLFSAGDGLFKLGCDFMSTPFISIMVPVLALGFIVHILYGCWLTAQNIKARGGVKRYEVASKAAADSWSAKNMLVLGIVILGLIAFHLTHFWAKMQLPELFGVGNFENNPYCLLEATFSKWW